MNAFYILAFLFLSILMVGGCEQMTSFNLSSGPTLKNVSSDPEKYLNQTITITGKAIGMTSMCLSYANVETAIQDSDGYWLSVKPAGNRALTYGETYSVTGRMTKYVGNIGLGDMTCYFLAE